uniref:Uncharacterized protein n=1 Tax=Cucumis melo TaxID=3656 RepID=A0A9I9E167_CUCME
SAHTRRPFSLCFTRRRSEEGNTTKKKNGRATCSSARDKEREMKREREHQR